MVSTFPMTSIRFHGRHKLQLTMHQYCFSWASASKKPYTDITFRFSAEITGTIIVQCIPVLRPFLQEVHAAISSKTFGTCARSSDNAKMTVSRNKFDPSGGTYSVTVTTIAAEKSAAQKGANSDSFGNHGQGFQDFDFELQPSTQAPSQAPSPGPSRGPSRDPSDEFELPIQNTNSNSKWSPVNSRE